MIKTLEVSIKSNLRDPFAESIKKRIKHDLGIKVKKVRTKRIFVFDTELTEKELEKARKQIFCDEQVDLASFDTITMPYDYMIHVAWKPGVADTTGRVSKEALEDIIKRKLKENETIYSSLQILIEGEISKEQAQQIAHLYANETVQDKKIWSKDEKPELLIPKFQIDITPKADYIDLNVSNEDLLNISKKRKLALNLKEMLSIKEYFNKEHVKQDREKIGLKAMPTDAELEVLAQTWSEHCKHKIFNADIKDSKGNVFENIPDEQKAIKEVEETNGKIIMDKNKIKEITVNSIFDTYVKNPSKELQQKHKWVKSILKDNAGAVDFDDDWLYTLKWESHNSPSAKEPYGGSYTGIVGVFRDPMGTGRGGKIIAGFWSFHTGSPNYNGELNPDLHPSQILDGVRRGVEAGGNRSGNPTVTGFTYFDEGFIGKPYIGVGASSIIPKEINGEPGWEKYVYKNDLAIVIGGRVGIDGIHGATESSLEGGKHISIGHVQIGDAYMQKKVQEFVNEARDKVLFKGVQDFGAGGISSAFGELAEFTNGAILDIGKQPLKYAGLMPWQILVSESQERMGLTTRPEHLSELKKLAEKHGIELTVLGTFNDSGKFFVKYNELACVYLDINFLHDGGPKFELDAEWLTPEERKLKEPKAVNVKDHNKMLKKLLANENICSYNYIVRQFDHEVQGGSAIKPLSGKYADVHGDASVTRPILKSYKGIAFSTANNPDLGKIDTYHMTLYNIDEAIRKVIAVGGNLNQIPLNDNFGWPSPLESSNNPDAKYKTAQLWRAAKALADGTRGFSNPCISGKDSMSLDGTIPLKTGGEKRISAPAMVQISSAALIDDVRYCLTMEPKNIGDLIYVLGTTKNELGASELYKTLGKVGRNVPVVNIPENIKLYNAHANCAKSLLLESSHGIYRGGLAVHLGLIAIAGDLGINCDLRKIKTDATLTDTQILYSQSAGRFVVTVAPQNKEKFENAMQGNTFVCIGTIVPEKTLKVIGTSGEIINANISELRKTYHSVFDSDIEVM